MKYRRDHYRGAAAAYSIKMIKCISGSLHSSLSSEIDSDGDRAVFDSSGGILPPFRTQDDALVDAYQVE